MVSLSSLFSRINILYIPLAIMGASSLYSFIYGYISWGGSFVAGGAIGLFLAEFARSFTEPKNNNTTTKDMISRIAAVWLIVAIQFVIPLVLELYDKYAFNIILLEVTSALTTTGLGVFVRSYSYDHPLNIFLTLVVVLGGYMAILTGYMIIRWLLLGGHGISWNYYTATDVNTISQKSTDVYADLNEMGWAGKSGLQPPALKRIPQIYLFGIFVFALALIANGMNPLQALQWTTHAVATAGPFPGIDIDNLYLSAIGSQSNILLMSMTFGGLVLPMLIFSRFVPSIIIPVLLLWLLILILCLINVFFLGWGSLWLQKILLCLNIALTGPIYYTIGYEIALPMMILAFIGIFPVGTGGGLSMVTLRELFIWLKDDIEVLAARPSQYNLSRYQVTAVKRGVSVSRSGLSFLLICKISILLFVLLLLSTQSETLVSALLLTVSAISNAGGVIDAYAAQGYSLSSVLNGVTSFALIIGMLAGRIEMLFPALIFLFINIDESIKRGNAASGKNVPKPNL